MPAGGLGRERGAEVMSAGATAPFAHEARAATSAVSKRRRRIDA
jgi:hypothetical protein